MLPNAIFYLARFLSLSSDVYDNEARERRKGGRIKASFNIYFYQSPELYRG